VAISVDPLTFVISVPTADLTLVQSSPSYIYELPLNDFRMWLKDWEDDGEIYGGMTFLKTHDHNTEVSLGGLTFARVIEILDPYTITFEDGQYAVNLIDANSNVSDKINVNQVSVRSANSAGLVAATSTVTASDVDTISAAVWDKLTADHEDTGSFGQKVGKKILTTGKFVALK